MDIRQYKKQALRWLAIFAILLPCTAISQDTLPHWKILPDKSSIEWTAIYAGKEIKGTFPDFSSDIIFSPDHLDASKVGIKIVIENLKSSDKDAQDSLLSLDWFAVSKFPIATFETTAFRHIKDDNYEADGNLTIRDKTVKITLPFTLKFFEDGDTAPSTRYARVTGETIIKRVDFGVGQGDWQKTDVIANDVKVSVKIEAKAY